ncbi:MAG: SprT family zinc-dependent metalloprotease [bacterium]|nr:SprT family zinc-dependent metalloprotease [bacterium]
MAREYCSITHGDTTIKFEVRRSDRRTKTVEVAVTPTGVRVYAPRAAPVAELERFVQTKAPWILGHLADLERACRPGIREGQIMPYLGRAVPLTYETGDLPGPVVDFDGNRFTVTAPHGQSDDSRLVSVSHAFVAWYNARAWERIPATVDAWWPLLGRGPRSRVLIRDQKSRWASCARDGTLRFNWRVIMLEPRLIDYVVVHELAHLHVKGHPPEFWNRVAGALPDLDERRRGLKEAASSLPLWNL